MVTALRSRTLQTVVTHNLSSVLPGTTLATSGYVNTGWISVTKWSGVNFGVSNILFYKNDGFGFFVLFYIHL